MVFATVFRRASQELLRILAEKEPKTALWVVPAGTEFNHNSTELRLRFSSKTVI